MRDSIQSANDETYQSPPEFPPSDDTTSETREPPSFAGALFWSLNLALACDLIFGPTTGNKHLTALAAGTVFLLPWLRFIWLFWQIRSQPANDAETMP